MQTPETTSEQSPPPTCGRHSERTTDAGQSRGENVSVVDFDHDRFKAAMRVVHDLGGETGGPIALEERKAESWEINTYAICECLSWRGVWTNVEKLRRGADLGDKYLAIPYSGRWLLAAARALVDKDYVTLTELTNKIEEVKSRHEQKPLRQNR